MARPTKAIVDYFPHNAISGKTLFILEQEFGDKGYCFWYKLLETLAQTEHHFLDLNNAAEMDFFRAKVRIDEDTCNKILEKLAKLDAIDKELLELKIIFSENFVKGIHDAYRNRKINVLFKKDILQFLSSNSSIEGISYVINEVSDVRNPQSKLKETKLNNNNFNKNFSEAKPVSLETTKKYLSEQQNIKTGSPLDFNKEQALEFINNLHPSLRKTSQIALALMQIHNINPEELNS
jgi:DNA-directed RNA polymerase subunit F